MPQCFDSARLEQAHASIKARLSKKTPLHVTKNNVNYRTPHSSSLMDNNNSFSGTAYSSSLSGSDNNLYQASLMRKKQIYIDRYNKRQTTPHHTQYLSVYCQSSSSVLKPKEIDAKEIHENDPFHKGPLLTYYCHPCNKRHYFHKGDVIISDGGHYYSSEESDDSSPCYNADVATVGGSDLSSFDGSFASPILKFTLKESVCCADDMCACPRSLTATVLCYDCHDDFHQNLCGEVVYLYDQRKGTTVARHLCNKCYNLCSAGRELCKHPGDNSGLVQCRECQKNFHADGCGWKETSIGPSGKRSFQPGYRCNVCVGNKRVSRKRRETILGKYIKDQNQITKHHIGAVNCSGKENDVWV